MKVHYIQSTTKMVDVNQALDAQNKLRDRLRIFADVEISGNVRAENVLNPAQYLIDNIQSAVEADMVIADAYTDGDRCAETMIAAVVALGKTIFKENIGGGMTNDVRNIG